VEETPQEKGFDVWTLFACVNSLEDMAFGMTTRTPNI